jgi:hypothetical protein
MFDSQHIYFYIPIISTEDTKHISTSNWISASISLLVRKFRMKDSFIVYLTLLLTELNTTSAQISSTDSDISDGDCSNFFSIDLQTNALKVIEVNPKRI